MIWIRYAVWLGQKRRCRYEGGWCQVGMSWCLRPLSCPFGSAPLRGVRSRFGCLGSGDVNDLSSSSSSKQSVTANFQCRLQSESGRIITRGQSGFRCGQGENCCWFSLLAVICLKPRRWTQGTHCCFTMQKHLPAPFLQGPVLAGTELLSTWLEK